MVESEPLAEALRGASRMVTMQLWDRFENVPQAGASIGVTRANFLSTHSPMRMLESSLPEPELLHPGGHTPTSGDAGSHS